MDRPNNLVVVDGIILLDEQPDRDAVLAVLAETVDRYPVLRRRAVGKRKRWTWVDDPGFDLANHLTWVQLPAGANVEAAQKFVAERRSEALPTDRPRWHMFLLGPIELADGRTGTAVVSRFHHSIADGVRLTQVLLSMCHADTDALPVRVARHDPRELARATADGAAAPRQRVANALSAAGSSRVVNDLFALGKIAFTRTAHSVWTGKPGVTKAVAWSAPIALSTVKEIGAATGTTINDVLAAAFAGGLRRWLADQHAQLKSANWLLPLNLTPLDAELPAELGNHFALVFLRMPLRAMPRAKRLNVVHRRMGRIKRSDEPLMTYALQRLVALSPHRIAFALTNFFANKAIGVLTNVPGPRHPIRFAGAPVRQVIGFAPCSGNQPVTATIFSYNNTVTVGFATDHALLPHPERLADLVVDEVAQMHAELVRA